MKILLYTRRTMTNWMRYLANNLTVASSTMIMSELRNEGDISIADDFYRYFHKPDIAEQASRQFGEDGCNDIIARCRLLRNLKKDMALKMIGSAGQSCRTLIDNFKPNIFLALRIDSYVLDIIDRILAERRIPYIGLWRAAVVPNMLFFTTRGEHIPLREPKEEEIKECISRVIDIEFKATSLKKNVKYNFWNFFKEQLYYNLRDNFIDIQRWIIRDPFGYRYLTTSKHVKEYRVRLKDLEVLRYMRKDWYELFESTPFEKRVFVGLQVNPEATIDYYVKNLELINCQNVLTRLVGVLENAGYKIFIKDHPNMFGKRQIEFYKVLSNFKAVTFVPYHVSSNILVKNSRITYTWTGTIGLQSAMAARVPVVVNPTFFIPGTFIQITSIADIDKLPEKISSFESPKNINKTRRELARRILSSSIPGTMKWKEFEKGVPSAIAGTKKLIESLNTYLPLFVKNKKLYKTNL